MSRLILGQWNALCDICGFEFKSSELRKNWQGLMVCSKDFEQRNQQDFIRIRPEKVTPPWVRPEPPDTFIDVCYIWERSAYADVAGADCALSDNNSLSYPLLAALKNGT